VKKCTQCHKLKDLSEFYRNSSSKDGRRTNCKVCQNKSRDKWAKKNSKRLSNLRREYCQRDDVKARRSEQQKEWRKTNLDWELWYKAKQRSSTKGVPFDIDREDIEIPEVCPALGIPIEIGSGGISDSSPTVDRIIPELGYVKGNIIVISAKANRIKSDATVDELGKVYHWLNTKTK